MNTFLQNQEVRHESQRRKRITRVLKQVQQVCLIVFAWLIGIAVLYGAYVMLFDQNFFTVTRVVVEGDLHHVTADEVRTLASIPDGSNLFRVPMSDVQKRVSVEPWVAEVTVRRKLPGTIWIYVTEREPVALMVGKDVQYVDAKGSAFPAGDDVLDDLPVLSGFSQKEPSNLMAALTLMSSYQRFPVAGDVGISEVHLDESQGFSIVGNAQPVMIRLGWKGFDDKLNQLSVLWPTIRSRGAVPQYVDTNVSGKVIAKYDN
ncbi:MAG: hypothetical protein COV45_01085 [Deltaproteobacteria bacterium CG11_big_fil_rev_8_21_14_0_20_47_16]|nr:MAG: hypothetical protein COV45_01085 [Deltaproteobacteria bacterium CG11_big_fil_rev_8_21_14_0_20_47_16]